MRIEGQLLNGFAIIEGQIAEGMYNAEKEAESALGRKATQHKTEAERELAIAKGGEASASQEGIIKKAVEGEMDKI